MIIYRDYTLTEDFDWQANVKPRLGNLLESVNVYSVSGKVIGWKIQFRGE